VGSSQKNHYISRTIPLLSRIESASIDPAERFHRGKAQIPPITMLAVEEKDRKWNKIVVMNN
jgi:hypothetical protein